MKLRYFYI